MAIIWSVNDYFYVAGSLNAENLHGDIWLNFSLVALTEAPAAFVGTFLMGKNCILYWFSNENCLRSEFPGPAQDAARRGGRGAGGRSRKRNMSFTSALK